MGGSHGRLESRGKKGSSYLVFGCLMQWQQQWQWVCISGLTLREQPLMYYINKGPFRKLGVTIYISNRDNLSCGFDYNNIKVATRLREKERIYPESRNYHPKDKKSKRKLLLPRANVPSLLAVPLRLLEPHCWCDSCWDLCPCCFAGR